MVTGPDRQVMRVVAEVAGVAGDRRLAAEVPELERVDLGARREARHREDDAVAQPVARMEDEEQALAPVLVEDGGVGEWLGDLVDEQFVHGREVGHERSFARSFAARLTG